MTHWKKTKSYFQTLFEPQKNILIFFFSYPIYINGHKNTSMNSWKKIFSSNVFVKTDGQLNELLNITVKWILGTKVTSNNDTGLTFSILLELLFNNSVSRAAPWSLKCNAATCLTSFFAQYSSWNLGAFCHYLYIIWHHLQYSRDMNKCIDIKITQ